MDAKNASNGQNPVPSPYVARDPEALARNLAKAAEAGGRALAAYLKPREDGRAVEEMVETTAEVMKTLARVGEYWSSDPSRLMDAQTRLFGSYLGSGKAHWRRWPATARIRLSPLCRRTSASPTRIGKRTRSSAL